MRSTSYNNVSKAQKFSLETLNKLRNDTRKMSLGDDIMVSTAGSYARHEASEQSDIDFSAFHVHGAVVPAQALEDCIKGVVSIEPAEGGTFGRSHDISELIENFGGTKETNASLTRRLLFLLE